MSYLNAREEMDYQILRTRMVREQLVVRGIKDERVIAAMEKVDRHLFVEEALAGSAYGDFSLPIGEGQTISKPYIVALMTEALDLLPQDRILEIGTGSGYQTAILASLCHQVFSIERIKSLALKARRLLSSLCCYNVTIRIGDGSQGWPEKMHFDAIIVTACAPKVPDPLLDQLADNGRMVIPVGVNGDQDLLQFRKKGERVIRTVIADCEFVRLIGKSGWHE